MIAVCLSSAARNTAQAHRLEMDGDHVPLYRHRIRPDSLTPGGLNLNEPNGGRRKLDCMAAVRQREAQEGGQAANVTVRSIFALGPRGGVNQK